MMAHETVSLNDKVALAKRVSLWNIGDIDHLKKVADEIRLKFGKNELITSENYSQLRSALFQLIADFKSTDNDSLFECELAEACDTASIISDFLRKQEVEMKVENPLSIVYLIASWAYSSTCVETRKIANGVISDLGNPLQDNSA